MPKVEFPLDTIKKTWGPQFEAAMCPAAVEFSGTPADPFTPEEVEEVLASCLDFDTDSYLGVFRLKDKRFACISAYLPEITDVRPIGYSRVAWDLKSLLKNGIAQYDKEILDFKE